MYIMLFGDIWFYVQEHLNSTKYRTHIKLLSTIVLTLPYSVFAYQLLTLLCYLSYSLEYV